jgi:hypothetical protein
MEAWRRPLYALTSVPKERAGDTHESPVVCVLEGLQGVSSCLSGPAGNTATRACIWNV